MQYKIENLEFNPISVTFENEKEVSWLAGLLTCTKICEIVRELNPCADAFFDNLYNAIKSGEKQDISIPFSDELGRGL